MAKQASGSIEIEPSANGSAVRDMAGAVVAAGTAVADRVPAVADNARAVADNAREALTGAQHQVDRLSDTGAVAALGFTLGLTGGLFLAGAPRLILGLAAIPVAITLRSVVNRGVRPMALLD